MNPIDELNEKFNYKADKRYFDSWKIIYSEEDNWYGDCEDYSLTLVYLLSNRSLTTTLSSILFHRYTFYYVKSPNGRGHVVLKLGKDSYIDNIKKRIVSKQNLINSKYSRFIPLPGVLVLVKMLLGKFIH
jgi:predicted transglutaminase-like cysteine proteinase